MIDPESLEKHRAAHIKLSKLVRDELARFFGTLNLSRPETARDALLAYVPGLITKYGPISEQLALEWYEELRFQSGALGSFRAVAPPIDMWDNLGEAAVQSVRFAAGHLFPDNPDADFDPSMTLKVLDVKMDKFVKEPGRQTMIFNAEYEGGGVSWARVPKGDETCSFCLVLASRGAVYHTDRTAGSERYGEENLFHGKCDCEIIRLGMFDDYPEGYVPEDIYDAYDESAKRIGRNDLKAILYDFRRRNPEMVTDGVYDDDYLSRIG